MSVTRHCRTRPRHPQGRHPQHRHRGAAVRRRRARAGRRRQRRRRRPGRRADRRRGQGAARRRARAWPSSWARTSPRRCWPSPRNYSHLLFPATAHGKNVAPRVAALLDVAQISDATKVISADTFERPIYAGNAIATVQSLDAIKVITVRTTGFDAAAASGGSAAVEKPGGGGRQRPVELRRQRDRQDRPARTHRGQDHRQRRPRAGLAATSSTKC